jgi:hypothetical protein
MLCRGGKQRWITQRSKYLAVQFVSKINLTRRPIIKAQKKSIT